MNIIKLLIKSFISGVIGLFTIILNILTYIFIIPVMLLILIKLVINNKYRNSLIKFIIDVIEFAFIHLDCNLRFYTHLKLTAEKYIGINQYEIKDEIEFKEEKESGKS